MALTSAAVPARAGTKGSTLAKFEAFMKIQFSEKKVEDMTQTPDRPLYTMVPKNSELSGESFIQPIKNGRAGGISKSHGKAYKNQKTSKGDRFNAVAGELYGFVTFGERLLRSARNNTGAFLENKATDARDTLEEMADEIATGLYVGNGGLPFAAIASSSGVSVSTDTTVTVADPNTLMNVYEGMAIVTEDDAAANVGIVISVDRLAGTFVVEGDMTSIAGGAAAWANDDPLYREGNFAGDGSTTFDFLYGLNEYIWDGQGGSATLHTLDRSADRTNFGGWYFGGDQALTGSTITRIRQAIVTMRSRGKAAAPDCVILNPEDWDAAVNEMGSQFVVSNSVTRWNRDGNDKNQSFGVQALTITAGGITVKVIADRFCPRGSAYVLRTDSWKLRSYGPLIDKVDFDGSVLERNAASNTSSGNEFEMRFCSFPLFITHAPRDNARVILT